uniref:Acetylglutamate kinase n=1 Tax=Gronococcus sybilensis TaxID=3028029 RepID=A0A9Y1MXL3_9RHOD|nr:acetylglutamate kinase [Gronococcus sybilensis]
MLNETNKIEILAEALPYIQRYSNRTVVVKYGGAAMKDSNLKEKVITDVIFLSCVGLRPVFVHGGGPEIDHWLNKVNIQPEFKDGVRVTDTATMEVVEMVLAGKINKELVSLVNKNGGSAVGICGKDGDLISVQRAKAFPMGFVGEVESINTHLIENLLDKKYIPIIASIGADNTAQSYNINADTVAGEIAAALKAEKLLLLTDSPGVCRDYKSPDTLIREIDTYEVRELLDTEIISGGMVPKINCCFQALNQGVESAHIIDGRIAHSLLLEILTDQGIGTIVSKTKEEIDL